MQLKKAARKASNRFLSTFYGYVLCSACNRYYFSGTETGQCNKRRCPEVINVSALRHAGPAKVG